MDELKKITDAVVNLTEAMNGTAVMSADPVLDPIVDDTLWLLHELGAARAARGMRHIADLEHTRLTMWAPTHDMRTVLRLAMEEAVNAKTTATTHDAAPETRES